MNQALARQYTEENCGKYGLPVPDMTEPLRSYLTDGGTCACLHYACPSCGFNHLIPVNGPRAWGWNGRLDLPTLSPSVKCEYPPGYEALPAGGVCHHFIRDGVLDLCPDSTVFGCGNGPRPTTNLLPLAILPD